MARLTQMPDRATVLALKGVLDFYEWKGVPVCRVWPRRDTMRQLPGEVTSSEEFVAVSKATALMQPNAKAVFNHTGGGRGFSWVDVARTYGRLTGGYRVG